MDTSFIPEESMEQIEVEYTEESSDSNVTKAPNKKNLWIGVISVVAILAIALGVTLFVKLRQTKNKTSDQYTANTTEVKIVNEQKETLEENTTNIEQTNVTEEKEPIEENEVVEEKQSIHYTITSIDTASFPVVSLQLSN